MKIEYIMNTFEQMGWSADSHRVIYTNDKGHICLGLAKKDLEPGTIKSFDELLKDN